MIIYMCKKAGTLANPRFSRDAVLFFLLSAQPTVVTVVIYTAEMLYRSPPVVAVDFETTS